MMPPTFLGIKFLDFSLSYIILLFVAKQLGLASFDYISVSTVIIVELEAANFLNVLNYLK